MTKPKPIARSVGSEEGPAFELVNEAPAAVASAGSVAVAVAPAAAPRAEVCQEVGVANAAGVATGMIQTVAGPIAAAELGVTMTHEHLLIDIRQLLPPPNTASARAFYEKVIDLLMDLSRCVWTSEVDPCCSPLYDRAAAVRRGLRLLPLRERVEQE